MEKTKKEERGMVPWAPMNSNPVITAVLAPLGEITTGQYMERMKERLAEMIRQAEPDAQEYIRNVLPTGVGWFPEDASPEELAQELMDLNDLVRVGLSNALPAYPFPAEVKGPNPWAKADLEKTRLETWLSLTIPQEKGVDR